jgi:hypothetical protein
MSFLDRYLESLAAEKKITEKKLEKKRYSSIDRDARIARYMHQYYVDHKDALNAKARHRRVEHREARLLAEAAV